MMDFDDYTIISLNEWRKGLRSSRKLCGRAKYEKAYVELNNQIESFYEFIEYAPGVVGRMPLPLLWTITILKNEMDELSDFYEPIDSDETTACSHTKTYVPYEYPQYPAPVREQRRQIKVESEIEAEPPTEGVVSKWAKKCWQTAKSTMERFSCTRKSGLELEDLPPELIVEVVRYFSVEETAKMARTSKGMLRLIEKHKNTLPRGTYTTVLIYLDEEENLTLSLEIKRREWKREHKFIDLPDGSVLVEMPISTDCFERKWYSNKPLAVDTHFRKLVERRDIKDCAFLRDLPSCDQLSVCEAMKNTPNLKIRDMQFRLVQPELAFVRRIIAVVGDRLKSLHVETKQDVDAEDFVELLTEMSGPIKRRNFDFQLKNVEECRIRLAHKFGKDPLTFSISAHFAILAYETWQIGQCKKLSMPVVDDVDFWSTMHEMLPERVPDVSVPSIEYRLIELRTNTICVKLTDKLFASEWLAISTTKDQVSLHDMVDYVFSTSEKHSFLEEIRRLNGAYLQRVLEMRRQQREQERLQEQQEQALNAQNA